MLKIKLGFALISSMLLLSCSGARQVNSPSVANNQEAAKQAAPAEGFTDKVGDAKATMTKVSLTEAEQKTELPEMGDRKIIKNAELTLEVDSPTDIQGTVTRIGETHGGFVVNSELKQRRTDDPARQAVDVTLVIRVPASQFGPTRDEILGLSKNILDSKTTGQDVTEEFIDLEARIKTQVALEAQFMEIMKQAHKVEDALEVQRQIADVRTEIEKLEGRKRFLENRSSLSTITVNLRSPGTVMVSATGFGYEIKEAVKESVGVAREIVLFMIRLVIVMLPVFIFLILPAFLIVRYLVRRIKRDRPLASEAAAQATAD
jgi:hypothetical protein